MSKLLLFGAGLVGRRILPRYKASFDIVALVDNDPAKQGRSLLGVEILSADQIHDVSYDYIVITSTATSQIYDQLIAMGIDDARIKEAAELHGDRFPWDAVVFLGIVGMAGVLGVCALL